MMSRLGNVGGRLYRGEVSVNFVGRKRTWYSISGAILLISIVALLVGGLDFSVDFKGGALFQFSAPSASVTQVQGAVTDAGVSGAIVLYLTIAFDWKMAIAAFVALIHDLVIATGVYALTGFQVSPATVIGLLTILGYSLYDTVVVFDKVRENRS